ncbi:hypothetical protein ACLOJK_023595 [Asimina triloba]
MVVQSNGNSRVASSPLFLLFIFSLISLSPIAANVRAGPCNIVFISFIVSSSRSPFQFSYSSDPLFPFAGLSASSARDRTKDILFVVVALYFNVSCGTPMTATMYLAWLIRTARMKPMTTNYQWRVYQDSVVPIGALYSLSLRLSNSAYIYLSVSLILMLKALMPVDVYSVVAFRKDTFRSDTMSNMVSISLGVAIAIAAYGKSRFVPGSWGPDEEATHHYHRCGGEQERKEHHLRRSQPSCPEDNSHLSKSLIFVVSANAFQHYINESFSFAVRCPPQQGTEGLDPKLSRMKKAQDAVVQTTNGVGKILMLMQSDFYGAPSSSPIQPICHLRPPRAASLHPSASPSIRRPHHHQQASTIPRAAAPPSASQRTRSTAQIQLAAATINEAFFSDASQHRRRQPITPTPLPPEPAATANRSVIHRSKSPMTSISDSSSSSAFKADDLQQSSAWPAPTSTVRTNYRTHPQPHSITHHDRRPRSSG